MASPAHAFFCFEVLASSFENKSHIDLKHLLDVYEATQEKGAVNKDHPANTIQTTSDEFVPKKDTQGTGQSPSISRLQATEPPARSESSTPSSTSGNSSSSRTTSTTTDVTPPSYASRLSVTEDYPLFVTWNLVSHSGHKSLRGCIGTFEPFPLEKGLEQYALTSAFEDTRFSPIPASLMPDLSCSLTLLADFEDCKNPLDWSLGTHGIRISFTHRYRRHGATYLPDVAVEQGWTKEETLESLMRKAGWDAGRRLLKGSSKPWEDVKDFQTVRYTGLKASATHTEWQEWREGVNLEAT